MPVRRFDRVDDQITTALGSLGFAFGPGTIAAIVRRSADSAAVETIFKAGTSGTTAQYQLNLAADGTIRLQSGSSTAFASGLTLVTADSWCLVGVTKATGTSTPRIHKFVFSTLTWTHTDAGSALANSSAPANSARIGATNTPSQFFGGDLGIMGVSNTVLNDAAFEALVTGEAAWDSAGFIAKWMFDQASTATAVEDDIGAAEQTAITGTTVVNEDIPWVTGATPHKTRISGAFASKPVHFKAGGVMTERPVKVKSGGAFG